MRSEFQFIHHIKEKYSLRKIGDDGAVLPKDHDTEHVVTSDMLVEDIDFRLDWTSPELLGHKALAVSLSDIAAMGATPKWAMISLGVPEILWNSDFVDCFYEGWHKLARQSAGFELVGGDISRSLDRLVIDSIVGGDVPKGRAILRSGAKVGDSIVVTFRLGGAAGGLKLLESGLSDGSEIESWQANLISAHRQPWPQTRTGIFLQEHGLANAMIDISDGLLSDLEHICASSQVGARLFAEKVPLNLNLSNFEPSFDEQLEFGLNGGEDYELLFTIDPNDLSKLSDIFIDRDDHGLFTVIGKVTSNTGKIELIRGGEVSVIEPSGYRHF